MPAYMKGMLSETGKLEINLAPPTAPIRGYSKKMVAQLNRELTKIQRNLSGIREMNQRVFSTDFSPVTARTRRNSCKSAAISCGGTRRSNFVR